METLCAHLLLRIYRFQYTLHNGNLDYGKPLRVEGGTMNSDKVTALVAIATGITLLYLGYLSGNSSTFIILTSTGVMSIAYYGIFRNPWEGGI